MPGMAVDTTSSTPVRASRSRHPSQAMVFEVLDQGIIGREAPASDRALAPPGRIAPQDGLFVVQVAGRARRLRRCRTCPRARR